MRDEVWEYEHVLVTIICRAFPSKQSVWLCVHVSHIHTIFHMRTHICTHVHALTHTCAPPHTHTHSKTKGFEKEQRLVYQIIEDAGNKGIWMREIRGKSNIAQSELTRCLRTLESRKLIKSVRSVQAARRKVRNGVEWCGE